MRVCAPVPREPLARPSDFRPETPRGRRASRPAPQRRQHSAKAHHSPSRGRPPAFPSGTPSGTRQRLVGRRREGVSGWEAAPCTGQQWGAAPEARPAGQAARAAHARPLARVALAPRAPCRPSWDPSFLLPACSLPSARVPQSEGLPPTSRAGVRRDLAGFLRPLPPAPNTASGPFVRVLGHAVCHAAEDMALA